jgi:hypothetical protein
MKLDEFAKKHVGKKVVLEDGKPIHTSQIMEIHSLGREHGQDFVNRRATESLGRSLQGLKKLNKLTRSEGKRVISAVRNYQAEVRGGITVPDSTYELSNGTVVVPGKRTPPIEMDNESFDEMDSESFDIVQKAENSARIAGRTDHGKLPYPPYRIGGIVPESAKVVDQLPFDEEPANRYQMDLIHRIRHDYNILYGVMCIEGCGHVIEMVDLTVTQANDVIDAGYKIVNRRKERLDQQKEEAAPGVNKARHRAVRYIEGE